MTETLKKYEIIQWDAIIIDNEYIQRPIVYIKPDTDFLQFISDSNFTVACKISNTGLEYDNYKTIYGKVNKSAYIPNYRPDFFEANGLYVITLLAEWNGYPEQHKQGIIVFAGINNPEIKDIKFPIPEDIVLENSINEPITNNEDDANNVNTDVVDENVNYTSGLIVSISFTILIIIVLIYFMYVMTKNIRGTV